MQGKILKLYTLTLEFDGIYIKHHFFVANLLFNQKCLSLRPAWQRPECLGCYLGTTEIFGRRFSSVRYLVSHLKVSSFFHLFPPPLSFSNFKMLSRIIYQPQLRYYWTKSYFFLHALITGKLWTNNIKKVAVVVQWLLYN